MSKSLFSFSRNIKPNKATFWHLALILLFVRLGANAQINNYTFSQAFEPYVALQMDSTLGTQTTDDQNFNNIRLGFTFSYNGQSYTSVSINHNGFVVMGRVSGYSFSDACISISNASGRALNSTNTGSTNNLVSAFNMDLQATSYSNFGIKREGSAPNRVFIVQWRDVRRYVSSAGSDSINVQIRLYETTNQVEFRYGRCILLQDQAVPLLVQVGLRGNSASEFACRKSNTNWSQTDPGTSNTDGVQFSTTLRPTPGTIFRYSPLPPAENDLGMVAILEPGNPSEGCVLTNNEKVKIVIRNNGTLAQSSLPVGYRLGNGTVVNQTFNRATPLASGKLDTLTFTQGADLSTIGTYRLVAFTKLASETAITRGNDSLLNYTITLKPARDLPQPIVTNLTVAQQNGWKLGKGKNRPSGNASGWTTAFPFASESVALTSTTSSGLVEDWIYSPNINISDYSVLIFKAAITADAFGSAPISDIGDDTIRIMASFDCGQSWRTLKAFKQSDLVADSIRNVMREYRFKLTNQTAAKAIIAFKFSNNNTPALSTYRFHFDDVEIREIPPFDAGVTNILRPRAASPGCVLSAQETISAVIRNYGSSSFSSIKLAYTLNGGAPVEETFTLTPALQSGNIDTVTFSIANGANLSQPGFYSFRVYSVLTGEIPITRANDTLSNYRVNLTAPFATPSPLFSNLSTMLSNSWKRGRGAVTPGVDSISNWNSSTSMRGIETLSLFVPSSASPLREWIYSPTFNLTNDIVLVCRMAISRGNTTALPGANMGDDTLKVMMTTDCGSTWKVVRKFSQQDIVAKTIDDTLRRFVFPVGTLATKASFAFFFSNSNTTTAGPTYRVHIRDVQLRNPLLSNDLGVSAILLPKSNAALCPLSSQETVSVVVTNYGLSPQVSSDVAFKVNNTPEKSVNFTFSPSPLLPGQSDTVVFSGANGANLNVPTTATLKAYTKLSTEDVGGVVNDTLGNYRVEIRRPLTGFTFAENFDFSTFTPSGWVPSPSLFPINQFAVKSGRGVGGSNAFSVLLTISNPRASLNSPRYLLPSTANFALRFRYRLADNSGEPTVLRGTDSLVVRYTKDCGQSYQTLIRIDSLSYSLNLNNQFIDTIANLVGLSGQEVMFTMIARLTKSDTSKANFDLDNWIIEQITANQQTQQLASFRAYPNPANDKLTIEAQSKDAQKVQMFDLSGKLMLQENLDGFQQKELSVGHLSKGVYLLRVQSHEKSFTQKIVLE